MRMRRVNFTIIVLLITGVFSDMWDTSDISNLRWWEKKKQGGEHFSKFNLFNNDPISSINEPFHYMIL